MEIYVKNYAIDLKKNNLYLFDFLQSDKNDGQICQMFMDPSGDMSWTNQTSIQMITAKDTFTKGFPFYGVTLTYADSAHFLIWPS
jgi:hypothetical protein